MTMLCSDHGDSKVGTVIMMHDAEIVTAAGGDDVGMGGCHCHWLLIIGVETNANAYDR